MTTDDPLHLLEERALPTARRGYDKTATDELLGKLRASLAALISARDAAEARAAELEQKLRERAEREREVTEALVVAARVRSESEREAEEIRARAKTEADAIVEEARSKTSGFEREAREAEELAKRARAELTSFLQALLSKVASPGANLESPVDDLLNRAGEAAGNAGREGSSDSHDPAPGPRRSGHRPR